MTDPVLELAPPRTVNLSLISHTNAGKTTLVRTLLQQDVGEVRDAAHVTEVATGYVMLQAGADTLMLWDTPGFGDTARLVRRLRLSGNPIGWLLTQVWDRFRDRPLWSSQQAVRNAREEADVILYLVNASEDPAGAAYVPLEMEVLGWIGKPVLLLLNQTGPPGPQSEADEERWGRHLADFPLVKDTLTLDAFARCWVQEGELLRQVIPHLPPDKAEAMGALVQAWTARNLERFHASMRVLAEQLAAVAADREEVPERGVGDRLRGAILNPAGGDHSPQARRAMGKLAERLDGGIKSSTDRLIALHGLSGRAARSCLQLRVRDGAVEKTRTSTAFRPQRPQRCASTSSATTARQDPAARGLPLARPAPLAAPSGPRNALHPFRFGPKMKAPFTLSPHERYHEHDAASRLPRWPSGRRCSALAYGRAGGEPRHAAHRSRRAGGAWQKRGAAQPRPGDRGGARRRTPDHPAGGVPVALVSCSAALPSCRGPACRPAAGSRAWAR